MITNTNPYFLLLVTFIPLFSFSQEIVFSEKDFAKNMASIEFERTESESHKNKLNYDWKIYFKIFRDTLALDFVSGREIFTIFNSSDFKNPSFQRFKKAHSNYVNFLGSYGTKKNRSFVYTKSSYKKFLVINHDDTNSKTTESILDFKLKNHIFFGQFTYNSQFYIIAWQKFTRIFTLYVLENDNTFQAFDIDLEKGNFYKDGKLAPFPKKSVSRDPVLYMGNVYYDKNQRILTQIKNNVPNANKDVTERNKFFVQDDMLNITLDYNKESTVLIIIDLKTLEGNTHQITKKTHLESDPFNQKSNSFLFKNLLFQIKGDKKDVSLNLFDLKTGIHHPIANINQKKPYIKNKNLLLSKELVSRFDLGSQVEDKEDIIQKRLRKIMKYGNQVGLQITENTDSFLISIGGYLERDNSSMFYMFGAVGGMAYGIAYPYGQYGGFVRDESLDLFIGKDKFELTYDEFVNPYQRMEDFLNKEYDNKPDKKTKWVTKFNIDSDYYLGYLDKKTKEYFIRKFN